MFFIFFEVVDFVEFKYLEGLLLELFSSFIGFISTAVVVIAGLEFCPSESSSGERVTGAVFKAM